MLGIRCKPLLRKGQPAGDPCPGPTDIIEVAAASAVAQAKSEGEDNQDASANDEDNWDTCEAIEDTGAGLTIGSMAAL